MRTTNVATIGIDLGKNTFHLTGLDQRGAIVLRQKTSRGQLERRFVNMSPCLIGMEPARAPITSGGNSPRSATMSG